MKTLAIALACASFALVACHKRDESTTTATVSACEAGACGQGEICDFDPLTGSAICLHTCASSDAGVGLHDASECPPGTTCWSPSSLGACVQTCTKTEDCAAAPPGYFADCVYAIGADGDAATFATCHYVPTTPRDAGPQDSGFDVITLFDTRTDG